MFVQLQYSNFLFTKLINKYGAYNIILSNIKYFFSLLRYLCEIPHRPTERDDMPYMYMPTFFSTRSFGNSLASGSIGTPKLREQSHDG